MQPHGGHVGRSTGRAHIMLTAAAALVTSTACGRVDYAPDANEPALDVGPSDAAAPDAPDEGDAGIDAGAADASAGDASAPDASAPRPNVVFVTSRTFDPIGMTPALATEACVSLAAEAGLDGEFVAWLASSTRDPSVALESSRGWVRTDGRPVVDTLDDLRAGRIWYPIATDERGVDVRDTGIDVMTGSLQNGSIAATCGDYTDAAGTLTVGSTRGTTDSAIRRFGGAPCDERYRLYCFGVGRRVPVAVTPVEGRIAFLSSSEFVTGGGLEAADAHCRTDAMGAGLEGDFIALLAMPGASATSRLAAGDGRPWVRLDGVPIAASASDVIAGQLQTPINVMPGTPPVYRSAIVWVGADTPTSPGSSFYTCEGWTGTMSANRAITALSSLTTPFEGGSASELCTRAHRVLCLQR
jgi:hypothetical protein